MKKIILLAVFLAMLPSMVLGIELKRGECIDLHQNQRIDANNTDYIPVSVCAENYTVARFNETCTNFIRDIVDSCVESVEQISENTAWFNESVIDELIACNVDNDIKTKDISRLINEYQNTSACGNLMIDAAKERNNTEECMRGQMKITSQVVLEKSNQWLAGIGGVAIGVCVYWAYKKRSQPKFIERPQRTTGV